MVTRFIAALALLSFAFFGEAVAVQFDDEFCDASHKSFIPQQWLKMEGEMFINNLSDCNTSDIHIELAHMADCRERNVCPFASIQSLKLSSDALQLIDSLLSPTAEPVQLPDGVHAYFVPDLCYAYCNPYKLVWIDSEAKRLNVLKSKTNNAGKPLEYLIEMYESIPR